MKKALLLSLFLVGCTHHVRIDNPYGVPVTLLARPDVAVEPDGISQLLEFVSLQKTLDDLWTWERSGRIGPWWGDAPGALSSVVVTPDFHRGAGIPVGTVTAVISPAGRATVTAVVEPAMALSRYRVVGEKRPSDLSSVNAKASQFDSSIHWTPDCQLGTTARSERTPSAARISTRV